VLQDVVHCDPKRAFRQHGVHLLAKPDLEPGEPRDRAQVPLPQPFLVAKILDLPPDPQPGGLGESQRDRSKTPRGARQFLGRLVAVAC
jgi:hypothetical protein